MIPELPAGVSSSPSAQHAIGHLLLKSPDPYPGAEYLPLATLLLPVLGSTIHGSVADWQRLLLLGFTLHHLIQFMRCPSGLLRASAVPAFPTQSEIPPTANWALVQLRIIKTAAVIMLLASPFLAVGFLRAVQSAMRPGEPLVDRFATRLCFIAVAVRPCAFLINIFRPHRPPPPSHFSIAAEELKVRSQALEKALIGRAAVAATISDLTDLRSRIKDPIADLRRALDNLARHRKSTLPATAAAQQVLSKSTTQLAQRTQNLVDRVMKRESILAQRRASASAVLLERTNEFITSTGTTLQRLGSSLAPPQANPEFH
ncbi:hypothetical protein PTTG_01989 [Puccinia triticina 1-1 BBBD Race 1]|uniref:Uncharacterized protein n=2 Tax=Puccinia triticina TaxID=208348 RepID=A0A0C4EMJ9_PUCT1|nr:uncharacterized protein PtA15_11A31 [Puccinia triticina]OAV90880.1 hypothetical protein PTTG_01989 [Puccinia triticina 1-1 BBBD Race 1]WAQ89344.1 hypothetical protein PtA15_11A31 [Puccinia triticina]WAR59393.1 hypothetical protein PtB15_11B33 [Puccinia triticina]